MSSVHSSHQRFALKLDPKHEEAFCNRGCAKLELPVEKHNPDDNVYGAVGSSDKIESAATRAT